MLQLDYHKIKEKPEASELANLFLLFCIVLYWGVMTDTRSIDHVVTPQGKRKNLKKYISYKKPVSVCPSACLYVSPNFFKLTSPNLYLGKSIIVLFVCLIFASPARILFK